MKLSYWGDYELPNIERIGKDILKELVPATQIGTDRKKAFDRFERMMNSNRRFKIKDFDYILLKRRQGYLTDSFTDTPGLEVNCIAKDSNRAQKLMDEATKLILRSQGRSYLGFTIDDSYVLSGPEFEDTRQDDDIELQMAFGFEIRVKWKD